MVGVTSTCRTSWSLRAPAGRRRHHQQQQQIGTRVMAWWRARVVVSVRRAWLAQNPLPASVPMYSVVTLPQPERISSILHGTNRKLNLIDGRNDSQMIFYDQLIPGSTLLGYLNADHWAVVVPIARTHDTIGSLFVTQNAYPREALTEAVLRFVEEDLAARGK